MSRLSRSGVTVRGLRRYLSVLLLCLLLRSATYTCARGPRGYAESTYRTLHYHTSKCCAPPRAAPPVSAHLYVNAYMHSREEHAHTRTRGFRVNIPFRRGFREVQRAISFRGCALKRVPTPGECNGLEDIFEPLCEISNLFC